MVRKSSDDEPFAALAFKIMNDPFVGSLTFVRVYSGVLESGASMMNTVKGKRERVGRMLAMHANHREDIKEARAGDILALCGLKTTTTGDTLCAAEHPVILERMEFPEPVIEVAVEPKTKADQEKMSTALGRLAMEDPSFRVSPAAKREHSPAGPTCGRLVCALATTAFLIISQTIRFKRLSPRRPQ